MKKNILIGAWVVLAGLLIALGPQFLFKACPYPSELHSDTPRCHWTVQALLGTGILISALGICLVFISELKTHIGLTVGIFIAGIVTIAIPHSLIQVVKVCTADMVCRRVTFPIVTVLGAIVLAGSAAYIVYLWKKVKI